MSAALQLQLLLLLLVAGAAGAPPPRPVATPWPEQYRAVIVTNLTESGGRLRQIEIYYDWPRGRALNLVRDQLSDDPLVDIQWTNGSAFLFDYHGSCQTFHYAIGLLPPDWTSRAAYLGREVVDGFDCHVWSSDTDFTRYDEDVATGRPVSWIAEGTRRHVLSFEPGVVVQDDSKYQAPAYCFNGVMQDDYYGSEPI